jgi:CelD/BcsL family acetyltransferase involved in cellulose biosynthesis
LRVLVEDEFACPTLLVAGREDEVRAIYDRPSVRRPQNYFERQGKLVIRDLTTWQAIAPHLDAFFQQHIDRWNNTDSASLFHDAQISRFYRELAENVANAGWMLFSIAELNGQPIAYHYGFDYNGALIWYKPSFDATHRQHSPGLVMVRHLIGFVLAHRRRELDFTLGDEAFKRRFTNHARKTVRVRVFHSRFAYETERARRAIVSKVKQLSPA